MWDYALLYHAALWHVAEKVRCPCHARWQPWGGLLGLDWGSPPVVSLWRTTLPNITAQESDELHYKYVPLYHFAAVIVIVLCFVLLLL